MTIFPPEVPAAEPPECNAAETQDKQNAAVVPEQSADRPIECRQPAPAECIPPLPAEGGPWLAHLTPDGRVQTIEEHAQGVAALCAAFAQPFGAAEYARTLGLYHDQGKYTQAFQRYLRAAVAQPDKPHAKCDHSTAGAQLLALARMQDAAFCVAGHHAGLPDQGTPYDPPGGATLCSRMKDYRERLAELPAERQKPPAPQRPAAPQDNLTSSFRIRMLFSCLVDADFLDTEAFMQGQQRQLAYDDMPTLLARLEAHIAPWLAADEQPLPTAPEKLRRAQLNRRRNQMLRACRSAGEGAKGLYTLTVPTGGGKTVASLAFALQQIAAHPELRRIIYVIPYTSIIEQTADVFRGILGANNVLEHHSQADLDNAGAPQGDGDPGEAAQRWRLAAENWDAPVVVTTNVQFFESLFGAKTSRCRKLHNVANSVIIFDEAQMLPLDHLKPCVRGIEELVLRYGATAVLCTATQPALDSLFSERCQPRKIIPDDEAQYQAFRRCTLQALGQQSWAGIAARMADAPQALCIVNRKADAEQLYALLPPEGRFYLTTDLTPRDRRARLAQIKQRLADGLPCRVASTSLVEAGVDLDFPTVLRQEAGLDSLLQAAGRCNREGRRPADESVVYWFCTDTPPHGDIGKCAALTRSLAATGADLAAPQTIRAYFTQLHEMQHGQLDKANALALLEKMELRTVGDTFRLIRENTCAVLIPQDETAQQLAQALHSGRQSLRLLMRQASPYLVSVRTNQLDGLLRAGAERLSPGLAVLTDLRLYSPETGLTHDPQGGQALMF